MSKVVSIKPTPKDLFNSLAKDDNIEEAIVILSKKDDGRVFSTFTESMTYPEILWYLEAIKQEIINEAMMTEE